MIVDIHAHYAPQAMLDRISRRAHEFPSVELLRKDDQYRLAFAGGQPTRPVSPKLRDAEQRLAWMTEQEIDHQVVGGWLDSFGYELPAEEGLAWSRFLNEEMLQATSRRPELTPLATVPLQDGRLAAKVLEETIEAGFVGAMIGTQPKGSSGNLDDTDLDPFWEAASRLKAAIYIHPMFGCGDPRLLDYDMINAVGRGLDTTTAVARLLFSGHFTRFAGAEVVLSHGGGALPFMLGRLVRNVQAHPDQYADPREGYARLWFDSVLFEPAALRFLCETASPDRVMLGSDYPFPIGDPKPLRVVHECEFSQPVESAILGDTAQRLFRIGSCSCR